MNLAERRATHDALLAFEAPYLVEKMVAERQVVSADAARALFQELKKYLLLQAESPRPIRMFSRRVDEVWHQFVLFTAEYAGFSRRFFGDYVHHTPNGAPGREDPSTLDEMPFGEFELAYRARFGEAPPDLWHDELSLDDDTRVIRADFGAPLEARLRDGRAELVWHLSPERVLLRAEARALDAIRFIIAHDVFYVRELPGLDEDDAVALVAPLVTTQVLRVAP